MLYCMMMNEFLCAGMRDLYIWRLVLGLAELIWAILKERKKKRKKLEEISDSAQHRIEATHEYDGGHHLIPAFQKGAF